MDTTTTGQGPGAPTGPAPGAPGSQTPTAGGSGSNTSSAPASGTTGGNASNTSGTSPGADTTTENWTLDSAVAEIRKLRQENAQRRVEQQQSEQRRQSESEHEKLQRQIREATTAREQAEHTLAEERQTRAIEAAAVGAFVVYPDLFALKYRGVLKTNDKGEFTNLKDVLAHARTAYPALFRVPSADGGAQSDGTPADPGPGVARMRAAYAQSSKQAQRE